MDSFDKGFSPEGRENRETHDAGFIEKIKNFSLVDITKYANKSAVKTELDKNPPLQQKTTGMSSPGTLFEAIVQLDKGLAGAVHSKLFILFAKRVFKKARNKAAETREKNKEAANYPGYVDDLD